MTDSYKIESELSGFIIAPKMIIQEYGRDAALVYGQVWLFAQQRHKVCFASIETIANELHMSTRSVRRHLKSLRENGYLIDTTPNLRYKPHVYKISGKVKLKQKTELVIEEPVGMTQSPIGYDSESTKYINNKRIKNKQTKNVCGGESKGKSQDSNNNNLQLRERGALKKASALPFLYTEDFRVLGFAFLEYAGADYTPTSEAEENYWIKEIKTWKSIGVNADMIKAVVADMRKSGLSIKSPASLTGMLRNYKATRAIQDDKVFSSFDEELY